MTGPDERRPAAEREEPLGSDATEFAGEHAGRSAAEGGGEEAVATRPQARRHGRDVGGPTLDPQSARQGRVVLRHRWTRAVFLAGTFGAVLLVLLLTILIGAR